MEIQYWADIACPYCYMGITQLQRALKELKIADQTPLKFMSFQLDPTLPTTTDLSMTEYYAKTHQLTKQEAATQIQKIDQLAADIDLPIKMENAIPVNTLAAHRLIKYIESLNDQALLNKAVKRLYQLYFNDNESITDYEALTVAMNEIRLPVASVKKVLESNHYEDEVRKNTRRAFILGMPSAPLFVIINKYSIPVALHYEVILDDLNTVQNPIYK
ncbi:DsbA family oxidoreductase, partial [Limosilactobacillus reuteri]|uniref:DsbA family oxidoreductase n=1 Tax=Limosilactobacillus reuteri TaxID=1598 RepID=UPI000B98894D